MKRMAFVISVMAISLFFLSSTAWAKTVIDESKNPKYLFVQTAKSGSFHGKTLTLMGVAPSTIYFSDRPHRIAGHMKTQQFLDFWNKGNNSFSKTPPNAVLSWDNGKETGETVVELYAPRIMKDALAYDVKFLYGKMPDKVGTCTLFIDALTVNQQITDFIP